MKLSTKSRYGLRAVYFLAQHYSKGEPLSLTKIALETQVSEPYLEKLLSILKKAEIVETVRGAAGGYKLAQSPKLLTVGKILRALEDDLRIADCVNSNCSGKNCPNKSVFTRLYTQINNFLDGMILQDILDENTYKKT